MHEIDLQFELTYVITYSIACDITYVITYVITYPYARTVNFEMCRQVIWQAIQIAFRHVFRVVFRQLILMACWHALRFEFRMCFGTQKEHKCLYDSSATSPNRFFIDIRLSMQWLVATNDMKDTGGQNPLDAQWLRTINICLSKCVA